jgi:dinuclear metal center YbgI/SA1388 family protein
VGLQLGDPEAPARTVALCHDVTEAVVEALEREPVDLLVAYHPLLYRPTRSLVAGRTPAGRALRLARRGIALAVVHTNFDVARGGAADALAEALELEEIAGFAPLHPQDSRKLVTFVPAADADRVLDALADAGGGRIGNYTHCSWRTEGTGTFFAGPGSDPAVGERGALNREAEVRLEVVVPAAREAAAVAALRAAHPYEEPAFDLYRRRGEAGLLGRIGRAQPGTTLASLAQLVREALGSAALRVAGAGTRSIERVAVLPGAGAGRLEEAWAARADAVVTGDIDHHRARAALDLGLCLLDPGHAATERPGLSRLLVWVAALGVEMRSFLDLDPDPWSAQPPPRSPWSE